MRKSVTVTISDEGRDKNKVFLVTEMPAAKTERWAAKAFLALARSGVDIPEEVSSAGLPGIAALGLKAFAGVRFEELEPLMDEMFECVQIVRDPKHPDVVSNLIGDDIEEVFTLLKLRKEVFELHVGFSHGAVASK